MIIADDKSTDETIGIVRELQANGLDLPLQIVLRPENLGLGRNVAEAVRRLDTPYFTKLDADDLYLNPKKLENELKLLKRERDLAVAYSITAKIDSEDQVISVPDSVELLPNGKDILYRRIAHMPREFLVSMDALREIGGYPTKPKLYVDWWLKSALAAHMPFRSTGEIGSGYRVYPRYVSTRMSSRHRFAHAYWISKGFIETRRLYDISVGLEDFLFFPKIWSNALLGVVEDAVRSVKPST